MNPNRAKETHDFNKYVAESLPPTRVFLEQRLPSADLGPAAPMSHHDVFHSTGHEYCTYSDITRTQHAERKRPGTIVEPPPPKRFLGNNGPFDGLQDDKARGNSQLTISQSIAGPSGSSGILKTFRRINKTAPSPDSSTTTRAHIDGILREADEHDENLAHVETYYEYRPSKLKAGLSHPDSVVETATLSSVSPPNIAYIHQIPDSVIDNGLISSLQLESMIYACQSHETKLPNGERAGYLIGDGAGVGKGRTIAAMIMENYRNGRKRSIWLSVSNDLRFDSSRDLQDIGARKIQVHQLTKLKYAPINSAENGKIKKGVIFATYTSLLGECRTGNYPDYRTRMQQLIRWFGEDYDGLIVFDECHKAKNLIPAGAGGKPTKTGKLVLELQESLPNARIVYASATGASEPRNMAYMSRLGLWGKGTTFPNFFSFLNVIERRGLGAMEIVAMEMKSRGLYLARQLSFRGVSFKTMRVPLTEEYARLYDESVKLWMEVKRQFQIAAQQLPEEQRHNMKLIWGQFWACHQRFFKYLCIAFKVEACVQLCDEAMADGKCIVIGLQSTGDARTKELVEDGVEITEFVSTAKRVLQELIIRYFPDSMDGSEDEDPLKYFEFGRRRSKKKTAKLPWDALNGKTATNGNGAVKKPNGSAECTDSTGGSESDAEASSDISVSSANLSDFTDTEVKHDDANWEKKLQQEALSSGSERDETTDPDDMDSITHVDAIAPFPEDTESSDDEEYEEDSSVFFNPFEFDYCNEIPYENRQRRKQLVHSKVRDPLKELKRSRDKRERRLANKRLARKKQRKRRELDSMRKRNELAKQAAANPSASEFMKSTKLCDDSYYDSLDVKNKLLAKVEELGKDLPANTLDHLINRLGGPDNVAEMTGRRYRIIQTESGEITHQRRNDKTDVALELINMEEKENFMSGRKKVAIISEVASSGISLQADKRAINQLPRVHITLELPWSADKAIQQFGRTHRSNQVVAPEYIFLISELAGEQRFASTVAKRLELLGALTHGDRRATETRDLSKFNLDTKYGRMALDSTLRSITGALRPPLLPEPDNYTPGPFFRDMCIYLESVGVLALSNGVYIVDKEGQKISKFLNRILGLPVYAQSALFSYFSDILEELVHKAKQDGTFDLGIMDLSSGDHVQKQDTRTYDGVYSNGKFHVELHKLSVDRGCSWTEAIEISSSHKLPEDGFYSTSESTRGTPCCVLVYTLASRRLTDTDRIYAVTRPSTGRSTRLETLAEIKKKYVKIELPKAEEMWKKQYDASAKQCQHQFLFGSCRNQDENHSFCEYGRRLRTYFVLAGMVLSIWPLLEEISPQTTQSNLASSRIQVVRVCTDEDQKIVGVLILPSNVRKLMAKIAEYSTSSQAIDHRKEKKQNGTSDTSSNSSPGAAKADEQPDNKPKKTETPPPK
ncbi:unnamed protein product, partial [Mesorhabditis spiculigera]